MYPDAAWYISIVGIVILSQYLARLRGSWAIEGNINRFRKKHTKPVSMTLSHW